MSILGGADFFASYILPPAVGCIVGGFAFLAYNMFMVKERIFGVNFSNGTYVWKSSDDTYWGDVKRFFDTKRHEHAA